MNRDHFVNLWILVKMCASDCRFWWFLDMWCVHFVIFGILMTINRYSNLSFEIYLCVNSRELTLTVILDMLWALFSDFFISGFLLWHITHGFWIFEISGFLVILGRFLVSLSGFCQVLSAFFSSGFCQVILWGHNFRFVIFVSGLGFWAQIWCFGRVFHGFSGFWIFVILSYFNSQCFSDFVIFWIFVSGLGF